jgi:HEAT repeat protein
MWLRIELCCLLLLGAGSAVPVRGWAADPFGDYELAMYERPKLELARVRMDFPPGLKELWLRALERPDAELQRAVIDTLAIAHRKGLQGAAEAKPRLLELLGQPDQRLDVLRSIAQTLVVLDAREQAATLQQLSQQHGLSIAQIVEPALARWESPLVEPVWLRRIEAAEAGPAMLGLAIDGLGELGSVSASEPLQRLVRSAENSMGIRMSAARALGRIHPSGLVELARELADQTSRPADLNPVLAIELLAQHDDPAAIELLNRLVDLESSTVQSRALERLYQIDILLVDTHADALLGSPDANVRRWCARAMIAKRDVGRIEALAGMLDDVNPGLRREVAAGLIALAADPLLRQEVLSQATRVLAQNPWRGCEQACVVLARLDHKPSGPRMVELLGHQRGEVQVASAWGLTQLRVAELLPDMLDHAQSVFDGFQAGQLSLSTPAASRHLAHLFIAFGDQQYRPADPLLREYLPKLNHLGYDSRPAAAWALGLIYQDNPQEDLARILVERLNDVGGLDPESQDMRHMCAISLGRMKAESALESLRRQAPGNRACYWAIQQITGEEPPPIPTLDREFSGWFLSPLRPSEGDDSPRE